ncbi:hypothetical protein [Amycolatopsis sp. NPDC051061]|uniref:hypothetical protein n=1 Tax=Amycolatopsis sp. NPDC051061 TaxID=3155042 RepID=UPI003421E928
MVHHVVVSFDLVRSLPDDRVRPAPRAGDRDGRRMEHTAPGVMLAFADSRNGHWLRLTDDTPIEKTEDVVSRWKGRPPQPSSDLSAC